VPVEIARANIEHFKKLLETESDAKKRAVIERLLAEEELKLEALKKRSARKENEPVVPLAPVRWVHIDGSNSNCVRPAMNSTPARKYERVKFVGFMDSQFKIAAEFWGPRPDLVASEGSTWDHPDNFPLELA
jgi:hypothetical protein